MDTLSTKTFRSKKLLHIDINSFVRFKIQRRQYTVDGFICVGTNFRELNKTDKFGIPNSCPLNFPSYFIQKIANSWVLEFVNRTLHGNHENGYPTKMKPSTEVV